MFIVSTNINFFINSAVYKDSSVLKVAAIVYIATILYTLNFLTVLSPTIKSNIFSENTCVQWMVGEIPCVNHKRNEEGWLINCEKYYSKHLNRWTQYSIYSTQNLVINGAPQQTWTNAFCYVLMKEVISIWIIAYHAAL